MSKNTLYQIFIVLIIGLFTTNFIIFRMKNELLTTITTITLVFGGIYKLINNFKKKNS